MVKSRAIYALIGILVLVLSSCTLPTMGSPSVTDLEATAVQQTVEAIDSQQNTTNNQNSNLPPSQNAPQPSNTAQSQSNTASQSSTTPQATATQQPTPTKKPTQNSSNAPAAQPLKLGTPNQIPVDVYYGSCDANDPTTIDLGLTVEPTNQVSSVILWYEIHSQNGTWGPYWKNMFLANVGDYSAEIDIGVDGPGTLGNTGGWVIYWVEATDKVGKIITSAYYSTTIIYCSPVIIGPPATLPLINFFAGPSQVVPNEQVVISWEVFDAACGVYLDGMPVGASDSYSYTVPAQGASAQYSHQLVAQGEPCANPNIATESLTITVNQPQAPNAPGNFDFSKWTEGPTAHFSWIDNSDNEDGFHIWDEYGLVSTLSANQHEWAVILVGYCGSTKAYQLSAFNSAGESYYPSTVYIDGLCEPAPPSIAKPTNTDDYYQHFYISVPRGSDYFNIYVDSNLIQQWVELDAYMSYSPPCGQEVWVYATGVNYAGESSPSNYLKIIGECP